MKKILSAVMIFSANCSAKDIYLGEGFGGTYWAISETLKHTEEMIIHNFFCVI